MHSSGNSKFDLCLFCMSGGPNLLYFPVENFFKAAFLCLGLACHLLCPSKGWCVESLLKLTLGQVTMDLGAFLAAGTWLKMCLWVSSTFLSLSWAQPHCATSGVILATAAVDVPKYYKFLLLSPLSTHSPILILKREREFVIFPHKTQRSGK